MALVLGASSLVGSVCAFLASKDLIFAELASPLMLAFVALLTCTIKYKEVLGELTDRMYGQQVLLQICIGPVTALFATGSFFPHAIAQSLFFMHINVLQW